MPSTDGININTENFLSTLRTSFIGRRTYLYQTVESTQSIALSLAEQETDNLHGTVIVAEHQTKGRGRMGRSWISPFGGIWLSIILKPKIKNSQITVLPLLSALSVCDVIKKMTKLNAKLKWPNDVVIDGRKVSGILLDLSTKADKIDFVVIGIGVNVNIDIKKINSDIVKSAGFYDITSLQNELHGKEIEKFDFIRLLLENIERYVFQLENEGAREIIKKCKKISDTLGKEVIVKQSNEILQGVAVDMDENDGFLLIETPYARIHKVVSGDVISTNITKK
ncbi:MAG TPA: biotin--[acetyl-CoA-carboxylase] ligase [Nitrososphaeraceae archaeon]|nr:biotin--[acetyl-CoA-carboxylase] ligase [Nitrososphaeraceae archaeon]